MTHRLQSWSGECRPRAGGNLGGTLSSRPIRHSTPSSTSQSSFTLKVNSDLVLTNVVVRDKKTGEVVRGLTANDFTILENGKPQQISSFDFESVDQAAPLNEATITGQAGHSIFNAKTGVATTEELRNHRLIVLFFDLTSMQPEDIERSAMPPAITSTARCSRPTSGRRRLARHIPFARSGFHRRTSSSCSTPLIHTPAIRGPGLSAGATSTTNQVEDTTSFTADESEYNDLNTDRELFAIASISKSLAYINEKKSMLYFSGGIQRDGIENQASLRSAINAAVRANLSIYSVDTRGLQAISPLGDATTGSLRGTGSLQRRGPAEQSRRQLQLPGSHGHALVRHRRQGLL